MPRSDEPRKPMSRERLRALLPDVWILVRPRLGLLSLGFVLMAVSRAAGLVMPATTKYLIDDVVGKHRADLLVPLTLAAAGATAVQGLTSFLLTQLLSKGAHRLIAEMRIRVQAHVGRLPLTYYDANKTGALVSRIMSDVEGVRNLIGTGLIELAGGLMTAVFALVMLLRINAALTGVGVALLVIFAGIIAWWLGKIRPIFRERGKINAEVTGRLTESLAGVRVVKGYHAEEREAKAFAGGALKLLGNAIRTLTAFSLMGLLSTALMGGVGALVMLFGGREILAGGMTLGSFVTFTIFLGFLIAPAFQIVATGTQLTEALAGLERTREVLGERSEEADGQRRIALAQIAGDVAFEDVDFAYEAGKTVLHGISFSSKPGTVTALVGPSGSGKSTIIGLVASFYTPTNGVVKVDGMDLRAVTLASYRSQLGVVLQESFLFDGTIRENVAFSRPEATAVEIDAACRIARVDEFALPFEKGYDTIVGERGIKLSGGQRQRVSIARAILARPRVLILDEATSSLDSESEALIQEGLAYLMKDRTTFVIAHRLSTVRRADQILVVQEGRILERGTHAELFAARGRYWELYTRQHGVEANMLLPVPVLEEGSEGNGRGREEADRALLGPLARVLGARS